MIEQGFEHEMRIRAKFERFQEYYDLIIQFRDPKSPCTSAKMYVGKYFTAKGEFDEVSNAAKPNDDVH